MGCDTGLKPRKKVQVGNTENSNQQVKEEKTMSSTMVRQEMPNFTMDAFNSATGHFTTVSSEDYKGKWAVVCFYPADFTFVCPTEIAAMNAKLKGGGDEFHRLASIIGFAATGSKRAHEHILEQLKMQNSGIATIKEAITEFASLINENDAQHSRVMNYLSAI